MKAFLKKWWPPLAMLAGLLVGVGYVVSFDIPRVEARRAAIVAWAKDKCTPVSFTDSEGAVSTAFRCHHIMRPTKGNLMYIQGVVSNGGIWAWQEKSNGKLRAVWNIQVECLRSPEGFSGLEPCSTLAVEPEQFRSTLGNLFAE